MVFYHGSATPYPYSLNLWDRFDDPLNIMKGVPNRPLPLIDVNQLLDEALQQREWVGPTAPVSKLENLLKASGLQSE